MALVDYSDSESDGERNNSEAQVKAPSPPAKKRKLSDTPSTLPPLPQSFRDLYSSTVRTSTQDDPSLHGGRKRVTPHVAGNWPTHVYLEWCPSLWESDVLAQLIGAQTLPRRRRRRSSSATTQPDTEGDVCSLLSNDLGVSLPLHISLSRPLALKTDQKDGFLNAMKEAIRKSKLEVFNISFKELKWHPNEDHTRWFLVLRVADEQNQLSQLLSKSNAVASHYKQPKLYVDDEDQGPVSMRQLQAHREQKGVSVASKFHVSIAWSLSAPSGSREAVRKKRDESQEEQMDLPESVTSLEIPFNEVKVRMGQDVSSLPLHPKRRKASGVFS